MQVARDAMAPFARECVPVLIEVRGSGNKVCGAYCADCVEKLVSHIVTKGPLVKYFVENILEHKNKNIRSCSIVALTLVLHHWRNVLDKSDVTHMEKALMSAISDASSTCRAHALVFFQAFQQHFRKRAAMLLATFDPKVQRRLASLELIPMHTALLPRPTHASNEDSSTV
jgi:hypothetical protein